MMKPERMFTFTSIVTGAIVLAVVLAPFSISQNPVEKVNGTPAGWSDDIRITDNPLSDKYSVIAVWNDTVHMVWEYDARNIFYSKSEDSGYTWSPRITLYSTSDGVNYPDIAVYENNVHIVFGDGGWPGKIKYINSTDGGNTWNTVKTIGTPNAFYRFAPRIFVNNTNLHIIWQDERDGSNKEIYYRRSLDGGITFDNGQGIDEDRRLSFSPGLLGGGCIAGDGSNISVTWSDLRDGDLERYWIISKDNGFTWEDGLGTPNVGRKLTDDTTDCNMGAITVNGTNIHLVWGDQKWPGPEYRIYYRNSTNNGLTWNPIQLLSGPNPLTASAEIKVNGNNLHVAWDDARDDGTTMEIYYKNSTDGGISWSPDVRLTNSTGSHSYHPRLGLNESTIHVTWWDRRDSNREIYYKRYPDFPDTSPPSHTNETPQPDSYKDAPGTNVSVHVTDPSGVNESTIQLYVNGSVVSHNLSPITDGYNVSYEGPGFEPGVIECRIVADDNLSNTLDFTWNFTVLALYEIQLHEGWNLISVPHVQVDTAIDDVLRDINGKWDYIQWYDAASGEWKSNATFKPQQLNDLFVINRTMAFWINITEPNVNLTVRGHLSTYTEIQLYAGWNLVGYSTQNTETVGNVLWGTGADRVEVYNATAPYRIKEVGPTYVMKPGEGYWVHVPTNTVWVIDW